MSTVHAPPRPEPAARRERTSVSPALVAAVAVGAVLRLWGLGTNRLGYDEAFTAMAGRLSPGALFPFLRANDSHPPLDYLLRSPLARLGASEWVIRMPSALCSIGALALFAWWLRGRGRLGVLAVGLMALSAFEIAHGRDARMYAELELLGVGTAMLCESWLRAPRRRHAALLGVLVFVGLLTHVSMFLLEAGLLLLPGRRHDRDAWRWRGALFAAVAAWAVVWGPSFLAQASGGHSDWIPRTTLAGVVETVASLTTGQVVGAGLVTAGVVVGGVLVGRRDRRLGAVFVVGFAVPLALAALAGLVAPVLLDRTLTLTAWAPALALAAVVDALLGRGRMIGAAALVALLAVMLPTTFTVVTGRSGVDHALRELGTLARPGDVIAVRSAAKLPEIEWSLGVRGQWPWHAVTVSGIRDTAGIELGTGAASGRVWVLDWNSRLRSADGYVRCAPDRDFGVSRILCLRSAEPLSTTDASAPEAPDDLALARVAHERHTTSVGSSQHFPA